MLRQIIAGAFLALSLPKAGVPFAAWLAPAFLFWDIRRAGGTGRAALLGAGFGFGFCFTSLFWIYSTCRFAGVPVPVSALAVAALGAVLSLNWAVFGGVCAYLGRSLPAGVLPWAWAASWAALESASAHYSPRVGVDLLEYTQYKFLPLIQVAALLGPHAVGFIVMAWGGALAELRGGERTAKANLVLSALLAAAAAAYGTAVLAARTTDADGARVAVLQPNIDQYRKWDGSYEEHIRSEFEGLLSANGEKPDLVVWPEAAVPGWLEAPANRTWLASWAGRLGAPMLVGAVSSSKDGRHNSAALLGPSGDVRGRYHKRRLVPFGEFVPLRPLFEGWIGILAQMGDFDPGARDQPVLEAGGLALSANICYEAVFPHLLRRDAARGARVFANLTNDGWYKDTAGPYQHFYTNVFRAVENRVTVVRAANTGISGVVDPYGVALARTELGERTRLDVRLPARDPFPNGSPFARHGDVFGALCVLAAAFFLSWARARKADASSPPGVGPSGTVRGENGGAPWT